MPKSSSPTKSKKGRGGKSIGETAIKSLAQLHSLGIKSVHLKLLMKMCSSDKEDSFRILIAKEKKKGLVANVDGDRNLFCLTEAGVAAAPKIPEPASQEELTELIKTVFQFSGTGTAGKVYNILLDGNRFMGPIMESLRLESNSSSFGLADSIMT